jgi:hypothetical protein
MATGRSASKWSVVSIEDNGGTMRDIPVSSINGVGISYEEQDVTALQDALKSALINHGSVGITLQGPFDNTAAQAASASGAAAALSGSHTVLEPLNGGQTPRTFGFYMGIRGFWATGDPQFGADGATSTKGFTVSEYIVDPATGYSCKLTMYPGTVAAWSVTGKWTT